MEAVAVVTSGPAASAGWTKPCARKRLRALRPPVPRERGDNARENSRPATAARCSTVRSESASQAEPSRQHRLERRRQTVAALGRERSELLGVQGVSFGERDDSHQRLRRRGPRPCHAISRASSSESGPERSASPAGRCELRARQVDDQEWGVRDPSRRGSRRDRATRARPSGRRRVSEAGRAACGRGPRAGVARPSTTRRGCPRPAHRRAQRGAPSVSSPSGSEARIAPTATPRSASTRAA